MLRGPERNEGHVSSNGRVSQLCSLDHLVLSVQLCPIVDAFSSVAMPCQDPGLGGTDMKLMSSRVTVEVAESVHGTPGRITSWDSGRRCSASPRTNAASSPRTTNTMKRWLGCFSWGNDKQASGGRL